MAAWKQFLIAIVILVAAAVVWARFFPGAPELLASWGIDWAQAAPPAAGKQDGGEDDKGPRGADIRDGDKGGGEGTDDRADRIERVQLAHDLAVFVKAVHGVFHKRGRHAPEEHQREHEQQHTGKQRCPDQEALSHK